jgi:2-amino-4-hydroxy-6-hydroxymethyldihydropteridine diphosphokinase
MGRVRRERWGPRTIDLDILLFGQEVIQEENLKVPHPFMHLRRFVLEPLAELVPDLIHPSLGVSIKALLRRLPDDDQVVTLMKVE